jgi:hypothetical protein
MTRVTVAVGNRTGETGKKQAHCYIYSFLCAWFKISKRKKLMYKSTNKSGWLNSTKTKARVIFNGYGRETFSSVFNIVTLCTLGLLFA